jgi:hypothetical protein
MFTNVAIRPLPVNIICLALYLRLSYTIIVAKYLSMEVVLPSAVVEEIGRIGVC